jgi:signal transduction histidine kinase
LILGHASRARRSDDPAVLKQALEGTESAARRAVAATRKLLDFSRLEESRPETLDLRELLEDMRPMLRQLFDPSIRIVIELGNHAQYVRFDRAQLELTLNLATNASRPCPTAAAFTIALPAPAGSPDVALVLSDTGIGMSEDVRRRCMEAFFTASRPDKAPGWGWRWPRSCCMRPMATSGWTARRAPAARSA